MEAFVQSVHEDLDAPMTWAEEETVPISDAAIAAAFGEINLTEHTVPELHAKNQQLYAVLQTICEKEAFIIVRAAGKSNGLEAWRRLCKRYDPSIGGRRGALLGNVLNPSRVNKIEEFSAAVESWEEQVRQYKNRRKPEGTSPTLDEDIRVAILESICPAEVEKHLQLNQAQFADYDEVRNTYLETRIGLKLKPGSSGSVDHGGPAPMDVGALGKGVEGKGGQKDKSKIVCPNCHKTGHYKSECWAPGGGAANQPSAKGQSSNASKGGKGKDGKGGKVKGKPKGKRGKGGKGKPKAVGNAEEKEPQGEEATAWDGGAWEGDCGQETEWSKAAAGSKASNYLALGAFHVAAPMEHEPEMDVHELEEEETAAEDPEVSVRRLFTTSSHPMFRWEDRAFCRSLQTCNGWRYQSCGFRCWIISRHQRRCDAATPSGEFGLGNLGSAASSATGTGSASGSARCCSTRATIRCIGVTANDDVESEGKADAKASVQASTPEVSFSERACKGKGSCKG